MISPPLAFEIALVIVRKPVRGASRGALERFAGRARRALRLRGEVNVLVASSRELRRLNRGFRGQDKPTDVLSFPSDGGGDIAICAEIAGAQARRLGHSAAAELKVLVLHGMLHLAGYDHETDAGEMARLEERLRRRFRLPVTLTGRAAHGRSKR